MIFGYVLALLFSEFKTLDSVMMIYVNAFNAVPRITMYPLIVIIFGFGFGSKVVGAFLITFFLVFYNAYQGSRSIPSEMTNNYAFLGASRWHLMRYVRAYVALGWAFALLPSAVAFSLISVITTEILISTAGLGALIIIATSYLDTRPRVLDYLRLDDASVALVPWRLGDLQGVPVDRGDRRAVVGYTGNGTPPTPRPPPPHAGEGGPTGHRRVFT